MTIAYINGLPYSAEDLERREELLRELAELENKNVTPHRKSFLEKISDYLFADKDEEAQTEA